MSQESVLESANNIFHNDDETIIEPITATAATTTTTTSISIDSRANLNESHLLPLQSNDENHSSLLETNLIKQNEPPDKDESTDSMTIDDTLDDADEQQTEIEDLSINNISKCQNQPRLVPIEKLLIEKCQNTIESCDQPVNKNLSTIRGSQSSTIDPEEEQKNLDTETVKEIMIEPNRSSEKPKENATIDHRSIESIDSDHGLNNDNDDDDLDLLQPMSEVPFNEADCSGQTQNESQFIDEHSGEEYSDATQSDEFSDMQMSSDSDRDYQQLAARKQRGRPPSRKPVKCVDPVLAGAKWTRTKQHDESSNELSLTIITSTEQPQPQQQQQQHQAKLGRRKRTKNDDNPSSLTAKNLKIDNEIKDGEQIIYQSNEITVVNKSAKTNETRSTSTNHGGGTEEKPKTFHRNDIDIISIGSNHRTTLPTIQDVCGNVIDMMQFQEMAAAQKGQNKSTATPQQTEPEIKSTEQSIISNEIGTATAAAAATTDRDVNNGIKIDVPVESKAIKIRKPHWKTIQKQKQMRKDAYNNWRAQLQSREHLNQSPCQSMSPPPDPDASNIDCPPESMDTIENTGNRIRTKIDGAATDTASGGGGGDGTPTAAAATSADDPIAGRKRIRKLKYGSYNFTEKRDQSKPKMVLKYKKRYKRKKTTVSSSTTQRRIAHAITDGTDDISLANRISLATNCSTPFDPNISMSMSTFQHSGDQQTSPIVSVRKKPGPKKGWKLALLQAKTKAATSVAAAHITSSSTTTPTTATTTPILATRGQITRRTSRHLSEQILTPQQQQQQQTRAAKQQHPDDEIASTSTTSFGSIFQKDIKPKRKYADVDPEDGTGTTTTKGVAASVTEACDGSDDDGGSSYDADENPDEQCAKKKLQKCQRTNDNNDRWTDGDCRLNNYNQVLQNRNKVLLDILEQRSLEMRDLKMLLLKNDVDGGDGDGATTSKQHQRIGGKRHNEPWSNTELLKAYALRSIHSTFYQYVQQHFAVPFPSATAIDRHMATNLRYFRGLQTDILQILEHMAAVWQDADRVTVIQITKIETTAIMELDCRTDSILGPHDTMTAIVARGLYGQWNHVVYIDFDMASHRDAIMETIERLHRCGLLVVACVCNYNENETDLWNELGVSMGCNYFAHPITSDFIYAFYYIDDILCAIRQHFIGGGFMLDMKSISADPIAQLIEEKSSLIPLTKDALSNAPYSVATNLKYAKEIFSKTTVQLMNLCLPHASGASAAADDTTLNCSQFIDTISSFYQLMKSSETPMKNRLNTKRMEDQSKILSEIQLNFYRLKCPGTTERMTEFQRATMMIIESTKMLQHSMKQKYKIDFFAMTHITDDFLTQQLNELHSSNRQLHHQHQHHRHYDRFTPITPLTLFAQIKQIFIDDTNTTAAIDSNEQDGGSNQQLVFLPSAISINKTHPESNYVDQLIEWCILQYKSKYPFAANDGNDDELYHHFHLFEDTFQIMQNPIVQIKDKPIAKMIKQLTTTTTVQSFGMPIDMIRTFVIQRHLLRIRYSNLIDVKLEKP